MAEIVLFLVIYCESLLTRCWCLPAPFGSQCSNWSGGSRGGGADAPHQHLERETCNIELGLNFRSGNFPGRILLESFGSSGCTHSEKEVSEYLLRLFLWNELPDTCFGREAWDEGDEWLARAPVICL